MTHDRVSHAAVALAFLTAFCGGAASAGPLSGTWKQTGSNAGACPTCSIAIKEDGSIAAVVANNGWSAKLSWLDPAGKHAAGRGSWKPGAGGAYDGKAIDVDMRVAGDRLTLTMTVSDGSIPGKIVGSYKRAAALLFDAPGQAAAISDDNGAGQIRNGVRRYTCPEGIPLVVTFSEDAAIAAVSVDGGPPARLAEKREFVYSNRQYSLEVHGRAATLRTPTGTDRCSQIPGQGNVIQGE